VKEHEVNEKARAQRGPSYALREQRGILLQIGLPFGFSIPAHRALMISLMLSVNQW
jgi:hypothetical protein